MTKKNKIITERGNNNWIPMLMKNKFDAKKAMGLW